MKIACLIVLAGLFYLTNGQFGLFGGGGSGIQTPLGALSLPVEGLGDLEELFLKDWLDFGKKYDKQYSPLEAPIRKANFLVNIDTITKLAQATGETALSFSLKINEFADLTFEEFDRMFNGLNRNGQLDSNLETSKAETYKVPIGADLPESVDWREKGLVTSVKNQKNCAGCWAFSVVGALEGYTAKRNGTLSDLSMQHLIDCASGKKYNNRGCLGGLLEPGFHFVEDNGINSYSSYPYEATDGRCRPKKGESATSCRGYVAIPSGDEDALARAAAFEGPISAAIHVTKYAQFYGDKVFEDSNCGNKTKNLNHAILIVGYGVEEDGRKYWLIKNSYGTTWGVDGYFKLARGKGNMCGIATYARYPVL